MPTATSALTPEVGAHVLAQVCRSSRLCEDGVRPLRFGENLMFLLPAESVIVRVGRSQDAARKEVAVARWLAGSGFPAVRLAALDQQPILVSEFPVTFWRYIEEDSRGVTSSDLGRMLRELHALPSPPDLDLPKFSPMPKVRDRLKSLPPGVLSEGEVSFLAERHAVLEERFARLSYVLPEGPVHGDAHAGNLLRSKVDGSVLLIDFEDFCWGPREWDATVEAVRYRSMGWASEQDYRAYVIEYGFDPVGWDGYPVLRDARELNMTTWLMQQAGHSDEVDTEIRTRIADLRDPDRPRRWRTF